MNHHFTVSAIDDYCKVTIGIQKVTQRPIRQPILVLGKGEGNLQMLQLQENKKRKEVEGRLEKEQEKKQKEDAVIPQVVPLPIADEGGVVRERVAAVEINEENKLEEGEKVEWMPNVGDSFWIRVVAVEDDGDNAERLVAMQPASVEDEGCLFWSGVRVVSQQQEGNGFVFVHAVNEPQNVEYKVNLEICVPYRVPSREGYLFYFVI